MGKRLTGHVGSVVRWGRGSQGTWGVWLGGEEAHRARGECGQVGKRLTGHVGSVQMGKRLTGLVGSVQMGKRLTGHVGSVVR